MDRTVNERSQLSRIAKRIEALRVFLSENSTPAAEASSREWHLFFAEMRQIQGNTSNDASFVATLLAKEYLSARFRLVDFDAAAKAQGAPGLDLDLSTADGKRVVGEIKTTVPYGVGDLGAQQKATFRKDFTKLREARAHHKFFFLTNERTHQIVQDRYAGELPGVEVILLGT